MPALYTVYRSQRFEDLVGQEAVARTLKNAITSGRVAHAYLFSGIRGTGKTSTARILAKAVNCERPVAGEPCGECPPCLAITQGAAIDLIEIDAASNRGIDEIRDLRDKAKYLPAALSRKVYIIDEAHQLTPEAFNALLKTLEEPPGHVLFILCTTEAHKLPATIVSRCQRFDFRRIAEPDIATRLRVIAENEQLAHDDGGLRLIATMAQGSMRDAITMLDQVASAGLDAIDEAAVRRQLGLVNSADMASLLAVAARGEAGEVLRQLDQVAGQGTDMRQLANGLAEMGRKAVLLSLGSAAAADLGLDAATEEHLSQAVGAGGREFAAAAFEAAVGVVTEMRQTHEPRLLLELMLLRLASRSGTGGAASGFGGRAETEAPPPAVTADSGDAPDLAPLEAPEAPAPSDPPGPVETALSNDDLAGVTAQWPALLRALSGSSGSLTAARVSALMRDARPVDLSEDLLTIGFRYAIHSERAQHPSNRDQLERTLQQVFGRAFRLQFRVLGNSAPAADGDRGGGLVQAAVDILGARVTDIRDRGQTP